MVAYKTTIFSLIALFSLPALSAPEANCRSVAYNDLLETRAPDAEIRVGRRGLYSSTIKGRCIYVDAAADGEFAKRHSEAHAALLDHVKREPTEGLDFMSAAPEGPLQRRDLGCNAICGGSERCGCGSCKYASQYCYAGGCTITYRCK